jgi:HSP20 family protein
MAEQTQVPVKQTAAAPARTVPTMFGALQREIDRLFEDFTPGLAFSRDLAEVKARMDLAETKDGLELTVELPGMEEKDVDVSVTDGMLTVSGEKKVETERKDQNYRFVERSYGSFSRSVPLPPGVKADQIKATMSKGVLKVTVPTPAKPEPQKIEVQATH